MSSPTEITSRPPSGTVVSPALAESAPLLGRPGDVLQHPGESLASNLYKGTAWLAQAGVLLLVGLVWGAVFSHRPLLPLFSPHPLLQSLGVLVVVQSVLVLQPTSSPGDKARGARVHTALHVLSLLLLGAGVAIIEANKIRSHGLHFHSAHGYLGVLTAAVLALQYLFGLLVWWGPTQRWVFGGADRAKALWKAHRWNGYVVALPLLLATVLSATYTDYNVNVLAISPWAAGVGVFFVAVGVYPRVHPRKLGLGQ